MKKTIILTIMVILIALPCFAELKQFSKTITVKVENNTLYITGNNLDYDKDLTPSITISGNSTIATITNFEKDLSYTWVENVTADTDLYLTDMANKINNMTACINDVKVNTNYYDKYVQCVSDRDSCNVFRTQNTDTQAKLSICTNDLTAKTNSLADLSAQKNACDTALSTTKNNLQDKDNQNGFLWFAFIVAGIVAIFLGIKLRPFGKFGRHPANDDTSKNFDKM